MKRPFEPEKPKKPYESEKRFNQSSSSSKEIPMSVPLQLVRKRNFREALDVLKKMRQSRAVLGLTASAYIALAKQEHGAEKKREHYQLALDAVFGIKDPTDQNLETIATCLTNLDQKDRAFEILSNIQSLSDTGLYQLAFYHINNNKYEPAIPFLLKIQRKGESVLLALARCYEEIQDFNAANMAYAEIYNTLPQASSDVAVSHARCLLKQGRLDEANVVMNASSSEDFKTKLARGRTLQSVGRYQEAIAVLTSLVEAEPNNKYNAISLARCYQEMGQYNYAVAVFQSALTVHPNDQEILNSLSICFQKAGSHQEAHDLLSVVENPAPENQLSHARALENMRRFEEAMQIYNALPKDFLTGQISKAICQEQMGRHNDAILTTMSIPDWQNNRLALLNLVRVYHSQKNYCLAIETGKKISNWKEDVEALLAISRAQQSQGNLVEAFLTLCTIPAEKRNNTVVLTFARTKQAMGQYEEACKILTSHSSPDDDIKLALAHCYEEMDRLDEALQLYQSLPGTERNRVGLAICYEKMGNFDESIRCLQSIEPKNKKVLLSLGRSYQKIGLYATALNIFKSIGSWRSDRDILLALGICLSEYSKNKNALSTLQSITLWEKDREVLLAISRVYTRATNYGMARSTVEKIVDWKNDQEALLAYAMALSEEGRVDEALSYFEIINERFPFYKEAHTKHAKVLLWHKRMTDTSFLDRCIKKFPYTAVLLELRVQCSLILKKSDAISLLEEAVTKFPYNISLHILLLQQLTMMNSPKANEVYGTCLKRFRGIPKLAGYINGILRANNFIPNEEYSFIYHDIKTVQINLPDAIKAALYIVKDNAIESYAVGGAVIAAIEEQPIKSDIDMIVVSHNVGHFEACVTRGCIVPDKHLKDLYHGRLANPPVNLDYYAVSLPIHSGSFINISTYTRDFTICCVYVNQDGVVFDPTGYGLDDINEKILRPICDPSELFARDPKRILRALKYILRGYTPVTSLVEALKEWQPSANLDRDHLYAVTRKLLNEWGVRFVKLLVEFGLLEKLYKVSPKETFEATLQLLAVEVKWSQSHSPFWSVQSSIADRKQLPVEVSGKREVNSHLAFTRDNSGKSEKGYEQPHTKKM